MLGRTDSRNRLLALLAVVTVLSGGLMVRLAYWQVIQRQEVVEAARQNGTIRDVRPAIRGTIYDRSGRVVLAQTIYKERLIASPADLSESGRTEVADALVKILGLSGKDATKLREAMDQDSHWVPLASYLDMDVANRIRAGLDDGTLAALRLDPQPVRVYPQAGGAPRTSLGAQVLGFVNGDGQGQYGVEQYYDELLAGKPEIDTIDPSLPLDQATHVDQQGVAGKDIRLTIDAGMQLKVEQEVYAAWSADRAKRVSAVVMDPKTGAIVAEASYPSYDANDYARIAATDPARFVDPIVSQVYEPGSVFKMLLASAALKSGTTTLDTKINDYGVMRLPSGASVADANRKSMGWMKFSDIVAWSRNVGVTQAALKLGPDVGTCSASLYRTWQSYGIGSGTGVDLAGEVSASGFVRDPAKTQWRDIDLANGSFGQGVAATPLQVMRAYVAMMNGGTLLTPYVVQPAQNAGGVRVIEPGLSQNLTWLMEHVISSVPGYAKGTLIPGYTVGGKTGTAQIWDPTADNGKGAWKVNIFNYSFYGFVGRNSPELAIGVVISEGKPNLVAQGVLPMNQESYQLFRRIAWDGIGTFAIPSQSNPPLPSASASAGPRSSPAPSPTPSASAMPPH